MKNIKIFTELGEGIGFGHFSRCSPIALVLSKRCQVDIFVYQKGESEYNVNLSPKIKTTLIDWKESITEIVQARDTVIIDSYLAQAKHFDQIASITKRTIVFDDYYRLEYNCRLILNPNASADIEKYPYKSQKDLIVGSRYIILRDAFQNLSHKELAKEVKEVTITVGGSDYRNLLPIFVKLLAQNYPKINFHVLTGNSKVKQKMEREYSRNNFKYYGLLNHYEMAAIFMQSDIALTNSGQTLGELVMTQTPFVAFCVDKDQHPIRDFYLKQNIIDYKIEWDDVNFEEKILNSFEGLLNLKKRQQFVDKSRNILDGNGVNRICEKIKKLANGI